MITSKRQPYTEIVLRQMDKNSKLVYIDVNGTTKDATVIGDPDFFDRINIILKNNLIL